MAYTEFYVQTTGSNLNSGSSNADAAAQTYVGTFVRGTGVFTVDSGDPASDGVTVGDFASIYTTSGATVATCVGRITARDATTVTISTTVLAGAVTNVSESASAATCKVGGAWAGPSTTVGFPFNFVTAALINTSSDPPRVNFKNGVTYEITAAITHANNGPIYWEGYTTSVGDSGLAKFGGDSASPTAPYTMFTGSATGNVYRRMIWDDNGGTTAGQSVGNNTIFDVTGTANRVEFCRFTNGYRTGLRLGGGGSLAYGCEVHSCQRDDANNFGGLQVLEECVAIRCISHHNDAGTDSNGFHVLSDSAEPVALIECISAFNGANGFHYGGNHVSAVARGCIAVGNGQSGFYSVGAAATTSVLLADLCISYDNGEYGFAHQNALHRSPFALVNCAEGSNASGATNNINASFIQNLTTLTADPFVDMVDGDFSLNTTAGGGAACRNAGLTGYLIDTAVFSAGAGNVGYPDIGALQHDDVGGGGGSVNGLLQLSALNGALQG